jgi:hypothetical protein
MRRESMGAIVTAVAALTLSTPWTAAFAQTRDTTHHHPADPHAGHAMPAADTVTHPHSGHGGGMLMASLGGGWRAMAMGQAFPVVTFNAPGEDSPLSRTEAYLTQPAAMINVESPGSRLVLRATLNFEGLTQPDGELTPGGWGEGFIDRRHPHTILHEAMLSANVWRGANGGFSLSAGKGFAPYGTDDPMSRPGLKYPTNHHLSQILERYTVNGVLVSGPWSAEAGVFAGAEPEGPYDFSNYEGFGDSFSGRVARRFGGTGTSARWELSASGASIAEAHHGDTERTTLWNGAVRHRGQSRLGMVYGLVEGSTSRPHHGDGFWSVLGELSVASGRHQTYYRVEYATRPEYAREGTGRTDFFRYDHDAEEIGATRWLISTVGYSFGATRGAVGAFPFVEAQLNKVSAERGDPLDPALLFGTDRFFSISTGFRLYFGGGPMRMGTYGVLDDMTTTHGASDGRGPAATSTHH